MATSVLQAEIEAKYKAPLADVLLGLLNRTPSYHDVAHQLGCSYSWVAEQCARLHIEKHAHYVIEGYTPQALETTA